MCPTFEAAPDEQARLCPRLDTLPPPPPGRTGWPWTEAPAPLPPTMPDGRPWPRVSIVTPSFNQGPYLEETLRSVLLQGYPNLEYVVMDGGSTDGSVAIIERYAPWLAHWQSEPDGGQAAAINAGLARSTGKIFQFINSDDVLLPGAMAEVATQLSGSVLAVAGGVVDFGIGPESVFTNHPLSAVAIVERSRQFHQPGIWFDRQAIVELGGYDASYDYVFDKKLMLQFIDVYPDRIAYSKKILVRFRLHPDSKTRSADGRFARETRRLVVELADRLKTADLAMACRRRAGRDQRRRARDAWHDQLDSQLASTDRPLRVLLRILGAILHDPRTRWTRRSRRAIMNLVAGADPSRR